MSETWARGSTRQWRRTREFVIRRDRGRCRAHRDGWCAMVPRDHACTDRAELTGPHAGHAHHTRGRAVTGDDPRHIVAACAPCNLHIGNPAAVDPEPSPVTRW